MSKEEKPCPGCGGFHDVEAPQEDMIQLSAAIMRLCNECDDVDAVMSALMVTVARISGSEGIQAEDLIATFVHTMSLFTKRNEVELYYAAVQQSARAKKRQEENKS